MAVTKPGDLGALDPVMTVSTNDLDPARSAAKGGSDELYPEGVPVPTGMPAGVQERVVEGEGTDPTAGEGVDGEMVVWEARYSKKNFIGRIFNRILLTIAWLALARYTWWLGHDQIENMTKLVGVIVLGFWAWLGFRVMQAHYGHYYRLTNRRLFQSTGIMSRRRDMMELLRVKDVFTRQQSLLERSLGLGTVVIVPDAKDLPTFYLLGVNDPKQVMDLIWHQARTERNSKTTMIDPV